MREYTEAQGRGFPPQYQPGSAASKEPSVREGEPRNPQHEAASKACGCKANVWCACVKFREYYNAEHDPDGFDAAAN